MTSKRYTIGTHRAAPLEETRRKLEPLLRVFGITRVANITGLDCIGVPVVVVCRPNSRSLAVAQGKGCSVLAAEVSGIMESVEFYHAENISKPLLYGSYNQLRFSSTLLDPSVLPKSAAGRYHEDLKLHWIEGVDLIQECRCWVPYELAHTDYTLPLLSDSGCFPMTSNGLASGNHICEAVAHGICEVVERDADALFALRSPRARERRRITLTSIEDGASALLLERFRAAHVSVGVWDMTTDLGIPAFRVVIMDEQLREERPLRPSVGMGCHPCREIALCRALTEAAQARLTVISGSRDDLPRERYEGSSALSELERIRSDAFDGEEHQSLAVVEDFNSDSIEEDIEWMRARLVRSGIRHLVSVNLTKPELGIAVSRVIVPGLETMRGTPGWTPGLRARAIAEAWN